MLPKAVTLINFPMHSIQEQDKYFKLHVQIFVLNGKTDLIFLRFLSASLTEIEIKNIPMFIYQHNKF